jgi:4-carboxymuconolactone decarboxylase
LRCPLRPRYGWAHPAAQRGRLCLILFLLQPFVLETAMDEKQRYETGSALRREVLGDAYVDRSPLRPGAFDADYLEMVTRHVWGDVWSRPGLDRRTRVLIVMAMLIALNRDEELRLHIRASAGNGVTREELKELFLQATVYVGIPAGRNAFIAANEEFAALDRAH